MTLKFYKTGFDVSKNGVYEDIEEYFDTTKWKWAISPQYTCEYKHLDPALDVTVKLPLDSHQFTKENLGDYCRAEDDDGTIYYYYVMNAQWKGKETLLVTLSLDTLTTFWKTINEHWSSETHITRQFKDRFKCYAGKTTANGIIDARNEEFSTVPLYRDNYYRINPTNSYKNWTLVYMTEYPSSDSLSENPVTCYCFPSTSTNIATGMTGDVWIRPSNVLENRNYFLVESKNAGDTFTIYKKDGSTWDYTMGDKCAAIRFWRTKIDDVYYFYVQVYPYINSMEYTEYTVGSILFHKCKQFWEESTIYFPACTYENPYYVNAGQEYQTLPAFSEWYKSFKTDSRLIKIRELPYAPFKESYDSAGLLQIAQDWEISGTWLKFTGSTFGNYQLMTAEGVYTPTVAKADVISLATHDIKRETKLYNSAFWGDKLVYDNNTWVAQWETYGELGFTRFPLTIQYAVSDGMDNGQCFKITTSFEYDTDFGNCMVCDKNTDLPYFTNEYLNYIRYGKYYDEKSANLNVASSFVSGLGSALSTVSSFAFSGATIASAGGPVGAGTGAIIGAVVGVATTAMSVAKTCATAYDTINSKLDTYSHQASSVSGTSDLSLFNFYSGNKLYRMTYQPRKEVKEMLYNYFRLYGYADDSYQKPVCSRRWVDFFKLEPVFTGDMMWNGFLDDIKTRMQLGFRVYHLPRVMDGSSTDTPHYDLNQERENWELSLWTWANGSAE